MVKKLLVMVVVALLGIVVAAVKRPNRVEDRSIHLHNTLNAASTGASAEMSAASAENRLPVLPPDTDVHGTFLPQGQGLVGVKVSAPHDQAATAKPRLAYVTYRVNDEDLPAHTFVLGPEGGFHFAPVQFLPARVQLKIRIEGEPADRRSSKVVELTGDRPVHTFEFKVNSR